MGLLVDSVFALAAPRTRRSTLLGRVHGDAARGCSAHAEIDLCRLPSTPPARRLLRARGDRPLVHLPDAPQRLAAPRTRRSTPTRQPASSSSTGCSAHAEIDPSLSRARLFTSWLLRARGDRPVCDPWEQAR